MIDPAAVANLGELGDWLRTGLTGGVLAILLGFWLRKKKDDREGWGALITALQLDVDNVRKQAAADAETADRRAQIAKTDYATLYGQHQECERRLNEVDAQLRGVHRQFVLLSSSQVLPPGTPTPSKAVADAAGRATEIVRKPDILSPEDHG